MLCYAAGQEHDAHVGGGTRGRHGGAAGEGASHRRGGETLRIKPLNTKKYIKDQVSTFPVIFIYRSVIDNVRKM